MVSSQWLAEQLKDKNKPKISILDCSWYMPAAQRNVSKDFEAQRIPGPFSCPDPPNPAH
jgi:3-mercaptopyruvate sulfurtransferase SseA